MLEARVIGFRNPKVMKVADRLARWHLKRQVSDPQLREKLMPSYIMGCKRILISDDYYPSLNRPNVEVVTDRIAEIRANSIVTEGGTEREVDTIIFGTGFEVTRPPIAKRIRGADGRTLDEHWRPSMYAYKGTFVPGFPNFAIMTGPNTGLGHNSMVFMIESQLNYILGALRHLKTSGTRVLEVNEDAVRSYRSYLERRMDGTVWTAGSCSSWYLDDTGRNTALWPTYSWSFRTQTREFDADAYQFAA
jgi:cation diffusion facilitator CzcD-associated flavoprotein CzcO